MVNNKNSEAVSVLAPAATGSDPDVHYLLGIAYQRLKRNEDARAHYNKFLQLAPNDKRAEKVRTILGS